MRAKWGTVGLVAAMGLVVATAAGAGETLRVDKGAAGTWQRLLKLKTTASALHTTAHPGDEHGGVLTLLSRGSLARKSRRSGFPERCISA